MRTWTRLGVAAVALSCGCEKDAVLDGGKADLKARGDMPLFPAEDFATEQPDLAVSGFSACGLPLPDPQCNEWLAGQPGIPFGLATDPMPDPAIHSSGVKRHAEGHLILSGGTSGRWAVVIDGCRSNGIEPYDTQWSQLDWSADTPPGTTISVTAHTGNVADAGQWTDPWTSPSTSSPVSLFDQLTPSPKDWLCADNLKNHYLEVEFTLKSNDAKVTPVLREMRVGFRCFCGEG